MANRRKSQSHSVVYQKWLENERETGESFGAVGRPDGASLHLTDGDRAKYVQQEWGSRDTRAPTPGSYSYPDESNIGSILVDNKTYKQIKRNGGTLRVGSGGFYDLRQRAETLKH